MRRQKKDDCDNEDIMTGFIPQFTRNRTNLNDAVFELSVAMINKSSIKIIKQKINLIYTRLEEQYRWISITAWNEEIDKIAKNNVCAGVII